MNYTNVSYAMSFARDTSGSTSLYLTLLALLAGYFVLQSFWPKQKYKGKFSPVDPVVGRAVASAKYDAIIVGCSVAGATTAIQLGRAGKKVLVIEQNWGEVDRIIGELLQPGGVHALRRMDLEHCISGDKSHSIRVDGYVVIQSQKSGGEVMKLTYPECSPSTMSEHLGLKVPKVTNKDDFLAHPKGRSFHQHNFVKCLREEVKKTKNVTTAVGRVTGFTYLAGTEPVKSSGKGEPKPWVTGVTWDADGVQHKDTAALTIACDGIMSSLRKHMSNGGFDKASSFVGLVMKHPAFKPTIPNPNHGHVILTRPNPVLIYQISPTETRVLVDIPGVVPKVADGSMTRYMLDVVAPQLPDSVRSAFIKAAEEGKYQSMPNRAFPARQPKMRGAILLGDSWNMRHPLTGAGMTVALRDAEILTNYLKAVDMRDPVAVDGCMEKFRKDRVAHASTINILANCLHMVFSTPPGCRDSRADIRDACYGYLLRGSMFSAGPVNLLACLTAVPGVLATHFFMVALYATRTAFVPYPTPSKLLRAYHTIRVACIMIMPQLEEEGVTVLSSRVITFLSNLVFRWRGHKIVR